MALPDPLPDDPRKWEGWKLYSSADCYERLGLSIHENPSRELIEENCRKLLVWWQKKLPLKNQPSNPLSQMLRSGLDEAPMFLTEARAILLDPTTRAEHDNVLLVQFRDNLTNEFKKYLDFALTDKVLKPADEVRLVDFARQNGLTEEAIAELIDEALERTGSVRMPPEEAKAVETNAAPAPPSNTTEEFKRMLRLTGLGPDDMTDDQRDALVNMAENLGLDASDAEDLIDDFLDEVEQAKLAPPPKSQNLSPAGKMATGMLPPTAPLKTGQPGSPGPRLTNRTAPRVTTRIQRQTDRILLSPQQLPEPNPALEHSQFPPYQNSVGGSMLLIPTGQFAMGSTAPDAAPNESPITQVHLSRFYISRHPVTNLMYEAFDAAHRNKRLATAGDDHPVVHVSSADAMKFCQWLSARERKKYRLPTEAEWEYAARGSENRIYPWGNAKLPIPCANFADRNTSFAWSDPEADDGFAETSPVGAFPHGASPFGVEDLAGNVWEWCLDFFETYKGGERINPRGPSSGVRRVYRGGSWRSRFSSLRATARGSNIPNFSCNDVGFRVVCEVD